MKNGAKVAALFVGYCSLSLPTELVIKLSNCYYVSCIRKNIISVSYLVMDGFTFKIKNKYISIFQNDMFFDSAKMFNEIYILNLQSSILNIKSKRLKSNHTTNLYLWHYQLGHINDKHLIR